MAERIGIIDADLMDNGTRHPNLALMKISGYHKGIGDEVELITDGYTNLEQYDEVFISKVFNFTYTPVGIENVANVVVGGTGFFEDGGENLPENIEHHKPDYNLYDDYINKQIALGANRTKYADYLDYSIGFMTRGCFRKCSFCVNKKYDCASLHSPLEEFIAEDRPYIYLWDDNIFAYPKWKEVFKTLNESGKPFQFRQGLDIRLLTNEKAEMLVNSHNRGDYIFAFDHIEEKELIVKKLEIWKRYCARISKLYVLCAYDSQDEIDIRNTFERIKVLMRYGCLPYIMRYEDYKISPYKDIYVQLARWCNQPQFFKKKSFREFCIANQDYKKDQSSYCSAYKSMISFEKEFPEIAEEYFDLKFENENVFKSQYGYGRRYANKQSCLKCINDGISWEQIIDDEQLLRMYFAKKIDLHCTQYDDSTCKDCNGYCERIFGLIRKSSFDHILTILKQETDFEPVTQENIPQISEIEDAIINTSKVLCNTGEAMSFEEMGYYLYSILYPNKRIDKVANRKYGENHSKMAALLDLANVNYNNHKSLVTESILGKLYNKLPDNEKRMVACKLCLRIPIIRNYYLEGKHDETIDRDLKVLSATTQKRRRSTVISVIRSIGDTIY